MPFVRPRPIAWCRNAVLLDGRGEDRATHPIPFAFRILARFRGAWRVVETGLPDCPETAEVAADLRDGGILPAIAPGLPRGEGGPPMSGAVIQAGGPDLKRSPVGCRTQRARPEGKSNSLTSPGRWP